MSINYGDLVPRVLKYEDTGIDAVVWQARKPPLCEEFIFGQDLQNDARRNLVKSLIPSGILKFRSSGLVDDIISTRNSVIPTILAANQLAIQNFTAIVNGWVIPVVASRVNGGDLTGASDYKMDYCVIKLDDAPELGLRHDLVYLEVWRALLAPNPSTNSKPSATTIYKYGNIDYKDTQVDDQMVSPDLLVETSKRVQIQYRLRVVSGVTIFSPRTGEQSYPDGVDNPAVKARGGNTVDSNYTFTNKANVGDAGLYIAGDGSDVAKSALKSVDGYVYAIPVLAVARRNKNSYDYTSNSNGAGISIRNYISSDTRSDRPDGYYYDEVVDSDVIDLRHKVYINNPDFKQLLEKNFRYLVMGQLDTRWDQDHTKDCFGLELTEIDTISKTDLQGTYTIAAPDGVRRRFTNEVDSQKVIGTYTYGIEKPSGVVQYYPGSNQKIILDVSSYGSGANIEITDTKKPRVSVGERVVTLTSTWTNVGGNDKNKYETIINVQDFSGITLTDQTIIQVDYDAVLPGTGLRFIPSKLYKVRNVREDAPKDYGFTFLGKNREASLPADTIYPGVLPNFPDTVIDYPVAVKTGNILGYSRVRTYHVLGNGTALYTIPKEIDGQTVSSIIRIRKAIVNPVGAFEDINIPDYASITKTASGFTVTLPGSFSNSNVIEFHLVMMQTSITIDPLVRGVREVAKDTYLSTSVTTSQTATFEFKTSDINIILGAPQYIKSDGSTSYFVYVSGVMKLVTITTGYTFGNTLIKVTFSGGYTPTVNSLIEFPVLISDTPVDQDIINITYTRKAYQGWGDSLRVSSGKKYAEILSIGDSFVHTMGTKAAGVKGDPLILGFSQKLSLANGRTEALLASNEINLKDLDNQQSNFIRFKLDNPWNKDTYAGSLPEVGDLILEKTMPVGSLKPIRGVVSYSWSLYSPDGTDRPLEFRTPKLDQSGNHQVVWYALVKHPVTGELLMLVVNYISSVTSSGDDSFTTVTNDKVSYDVFRLKHRPLILL